MTMEKKSFGSFRHGMRRKMKEDNTKVMTDDYEMKDEYDFSSGIRGRFHTPKKKSTTIRLDVQSIGYR